MAQAYTLIRGLGEFAAAREQFNYLVDRLQSKETAGMEHGEIEELIRADGMELLRRLVARAFELACGQRSEALWGRG